MKKFTSFICLTAVLTAFCFGFTGCSDAKAAEDITENALEDVTVVGSTDKIVTDYTDCQIYLPDGKTIYGEVVSWTVVSENLIQVTLVYQRTVQLRTVEETHTYLVSPDRIALFNIEE